MKIEIMYQQSHITNVSDEKQPVGKKIVIRNNMLEWSFEIMYMELVAAAK